MNGRNPLILLDGRLCIHIGDVLDRLRDLPDESVDTVVTSPPYWGLRDYGTAFWEGGDPSCQHRRTGATRTAWASRLKSPTHAGKHGIHDASPVREVGGYCDQCGARRVDYQIGLEQTLGQHIDVMVAVFAEIHRVLKKHGTVWMNYGDCYAAAPNGRSASATKAAGDDDRTFRDKPFSTVGPIYDPHYATARGRFSASDVGAGQVGTRRLDHGGRVVAGGMLKEKDLCMIPARLAIALQEWGWWVRAKVIWGKTNPMPDSSGNGRPSNAYEEIYLLTKSADADVWRAIDTGELSFDPDHSERVKFRSKRDEVTKELADGARRWVRIGSYYDASALMQPSSPSTHARVSQNVDAQHGSDRAHAGGRKNGPMKAVTSKLQPAGVRIRANVSYDAAMKSRDIERAKARGLTTRHIGHINHTGLGALGRGHGRLIRNFEPSPRLATAPVTVWPIATVPYKEAHFATFPPRLAELCIVAGAPKNGVVLDPFGGAGTTALVALRLGRKAHLIELKPEYVDMATNRILADWQGEEEARLAAGKRKHKALEAAQALDPLPLFDEAEK